MDGWPGRVSLGELVKYQDDILANAHPSYMILVLTLLDIEHLC